jgi:hypothetical protein
MSGGEALWFIANFLVAILCVVIAWQVSLALGIVFWILLTLVLLVFRPQ